MRNPARLSLRPTARRAGAAYIACIVVALGVLCAGAGTTFASNTAKPVLRIGQLTGFGFFALDPAKDGQIYDVSRSLVYEQIIRQNADGSFKPGLAVSWRYVKDPSGPNKVFEFTLRKNARFSDGVPVNAQTVIAWLNYFAKTSRYGGLLTKPTFSPVGRWTVKIQVITPNPSIPSVLAQNNYGAAAGPKGVADPASLATATDGAGPYMLDASQSLTNDHYTYVPNPYYYDKSAVRFSKVEVKIFGNTTTLLQAIQAGQLDVVNGGDAATAPAATQAGLKVVYGPSGVAGLLLLDRNSKPLSDVRVRQALNYAIDRKTITNALMGNYATPTSEWVTTDGFDPTVKNYYSYSPSKAKSLLAAAGYSNGLSLTVGDYNGLGNLVAPLTQVIAKYLDAVGVKLNIQTLSQDQLRALLAKGQLPVINTPWATGPMAQTITLTQLPTSPVNPFHVNDPTLNKLFYKGLRSTDATSEFRQISQRMVKQANELPVFEYPNFYYVGKHVGGIAVSEKHPFSPAEDWLWK
jgi:peptide/nickel transport system substrate-binding protein